MTDMFRDLLDAFRFIADDQDNDELKSTVNSISDDMSASDELLNLDEDFIPDNYHDLIHYDDLVSGMIGNVPDEDLDKDLKLFRKIARLLGLKREDDLIAYHDEDGLYNPENFKNDGVHQIKDGIKMYNIFGLNVVYESRYMSFLYFKDEEEAEYYLECCEKENEYGY